jgi:hypothetical protein
VAAASNDFTSNINLALSGMQNLLRQYQRLSEFGDYSYFGDNASPAAAPFIDADVLHPTDQAVLLNGGCGAMHFVCVRSEAAATEQPQLHDSSATATALHAPEGSRFCFRDSASSTACNSSSSLPRDDDNDAASAAGASAASTTAQLLPQHSFSDYTAVCCAFSFSSSNDTSYSFSDVQLAHLPQPRFQFLFQRHAICASACRQQLQRGTATAFCNQQHPSNMHQQFNISALQQQQSFGSSACASVSAFSNAPALQLQLLQ